MLQVSSVDLQYIWKAKGPRNFGILPPLPLRKHAESQENDGQTGPRA